MAGAAAGAGAAGKNAACGGLSLSGCGADAACLPCADPGYTCQRSNEWYYECREGAAAGAPAAVLPVQPARPALGRWAHCGGVNTPGCGKDEACFDCADAGFSCLRSSEFFWQCTDRGTGGRPGASGIAAWGRCGGYSHECAEDGPCMDCAPKLSCNRVNAYHYQCEPQGREPVTLSAVRSETDAPQAGAAEAAPAAVARWQPCGGINTPGCGKDEACFTCADPTYSCKRGSEYYYQCEPNQGGQEGAPPLPGDAVKRWAACGGVNTAGCGKDEACFTCEDPEKFSCDRQSEWYWGCQPAAQPAPAAPSPGDAVARWAACGGMNTPGCGKDEACFTCEDPEKFSCDRQSEWYWGCHPTQPGQSEKPPLPGDPVERWAPCGGLNTAGCSKDEACFTCKDPTFTCFRQSEWYYGCMPEQPPAPKPPAPGDAVARWAACGGMNTPGCGKDEACFTCGDPTFSCDRQSEWYWGCRPEDSTVAPPAPGDSVKRWAACGGMNTAGCDKDEACFTCEGDGFSCLRQSEWYWGCQPAQGRPQVSRPSVPSDSQTAEPASADSGSAASESLGEKQVVPAGTDQEAEDWGSIVLGQPPEKRAVGELDSELYSDFYAELYDGDTAAANEDAVTQFSGP